MKFTLEEFFAQVRFFRDMMGSKTFWAKSDKERAEAVRGLGFVYFNTVVDKPGDNDVLVNIFTATMSEYNRREAMILIGV